MALYSEHPILTLILWMFANPKSEEDDDEEEEKCVKWSQESVQVFCSNTPPNCVFPSYRKKSIGSCSPPILRYPKM
jgi:hypothetical protein